MHEEDIQVPPQWIWKSDTTVPLAPLTLSLFLLIEPRMNSFLQDAISMTLISVYGEASAYG